MIGDHYLSVRTWRPDFDSFSDVLTSLTVWVRFPCLPIEYYDANLLLRIGSKLRKPIKVDTNTNLVTRDRYA